MTIKSSSSSYSKKKRNNFENTKQKKKFKKGNKMSKGKGKCFLCRKKDH